MEHLTLRVLCLSALVIMTVQGNSIYQPCLSNSDCPASSTCRMRACDGKICLCNSGTLPNNDNTKCIPGMLNYALGKSTSQVSTSTQCTSGKAVDGTLETSLYVGGVCSCARTLETGTLNPWWRVDLTQNSIIQHICITNKLDGTGVLHDFQVWLYDTYDPAVKPELQTHRTCYTHTGQVANGATVCFACTQSNAGRHLVVRTPGTETSEILSLCEVQIFGSSLGGLCDDVNIGCLTIDSACISGKCTCKDGYEPTSSNSRCKLKGTGTKTYATLGDVCGANAECQNSFEQTCDSSSQKCICDATKNMRAATLEELHAQPLKNAQCRHVNYSLENMPASLCPPKILLSDYDCTIVVKADDKTDSQTPTFSFADVPDSDTCWQHCNSRTDVICLAARYTTASKECSLFTYPSYTKVETALVGTTLYSRTCTPIQKKIGETCSSSTHCPSSATCRTRNCDGLICLCDSGHLPKADKTGCVIKGELDGDCSAIKGCPSPFSECVASKCVCQDGYVMADTLRCRPTNKPDVTYALLKETCTSASICFPSSMTCSSGTCQCSSGYRDATTEEKTADPFSVDECRKTDFDLNVCQRTTTTLTTATTAATAQTTIATTQSAVTTTKSSSSGSSSSTTPSFETIMAIVGTVLGLLVLGLILACVAVCYKQRVCCFDDPYYERKPRHFSDHSHESDHSPYLHAVERFNAVRY